MTVIVTLDVLQLMVLQSWQIATHHYVSNNYNKLQVEHNQLLCAHAHFCDCRCFNALYRRTNHHHCQSVVAVQFLSGRITDLQSENKRSSPPSILWMDLLQVLTLCSTEQMIYPPLTDLGSVCHSLSIISLCFSALPSLLC